MQVRFDAGGGNVTVGGKQYRLKQMHWHSPSEHTVDGQRFPVELHMVHASDDGNVTVVAMLYRFGRPDPFLSQVLSRPHVFETHVPRFPTLPRARD